MLLRILIPLAIVLVALFSCNSPETKNSTTASVVDSAFEPGSFGYDLNFLQQHDSVLVLENSSGNSRIIVSAKYQAKVFTSTADGNNGVSFGWVNYRAFGDTLDAHMNAYGGENRLWLGPEGGKFSLFFKPKSEMVFQNWKTPAVFDSEPWEVTNKNNQSVTMYKAMHLQNYKGTSLEINVERSVKILDDKAVMLNLGLPADTSVKTVGYETNNIITNSGQNDWTENTGMPCIWILDMFKPSPSTVIIVPFKNAGAQSFSKVATTNYFGEVPADRLKHTNDVIYFKADGKSRGKIGVSPAFAKPFAGSYDYQNQLLTIVTFDVDSSAKYLNQEWNTTKPSFAGDAVNAYNDGPLGDGSQMGPFYEIESVSPAAFLKKGQSLAHKQSVFHFTGNENSLNKIMKQLLGVSVEDVKNTF